VTSPWIEDPKTIIALGAAVGGWASAGIALKNSRSARSQLGIAQDQESRRKPDLDLYLVEGRYERLPGWMRYAFSIVVRNVSDRPNSIASAVLVIRYRSDGGSTLLARIAHTAPQFNGSSAISIQSAVTLPVNIDANKAAAGIISFDVNENVVSPMVIEDYELELIDTFGERTSVTMVLLSEIVGGSWP
jgi:hypothetical protein